MAQKKKTVTGEVTSTSPIMSYEDAVTPMMNLLHDHYPSVTMYQLTEVLVAIERFDKGPCEDSNYWGNLDAAYFDGLLNGMRALLALHAIRK